MDIVSRAGWGARPATKTIYTTWDRRLYVVYHHTGAGDERASVRGIQDYCMLTKGHSDIDYNVLIRNDERGTIYEGREGIWLTIGSHCLNNNTASIGVCFIAANDDPSTPTPNDEPLTAAAKAAGRWVFEEARRRQGAALGYTKLVAKVHKDLTETDCPMGPITAWVRAGMPAEGIDMGRQLVTTDVQKALHDAGFDIGTTGPAGDGVDDDWGVKCQTALTDAFRAAREGGAGLPDEFAFTAKGTLTPVKE